MLQAIFDNRLQQHAGHERFERGIVDLFHNFQVFAAKAGHFDVQVVVDELQFLAKRYKRFVLAQQPAKDIAQLEHHPAGRVRIKTDQRRYGVQRIEKKMGVDLPRQRVHTRLEQKLLVPLKVHFVARVVPNFQG